MKLIRIAWASVHPFATGIQRCTALVDSMAWDVPCLTIVHLLFMKAMMDSNAGAIVQSLAPWENLSALDTLTKWDVPNAHGDYCTPEVWSNGCMGFCEASCDWNNGEHWCPGEIYDEENWCFAPSWCSTDPTCGGMYSRSEERVEAEKKAKKVKA